MKTGTKIALGIGGLVLVGGLIFLMTRKKDDEITAVEEDNGQPDEENPESEYGGKVLYDSLKPEPQYGGNIIFDSMDETKKDVTKMPQVDWTQDPYYYI